MSTCNYSKSLKDFILRFDGEFYLSAGSSTYSHQRTMGMANYLGKALTTGCYDNSACYVKTELMDMNTLTGEGRSKLSTVES